MPTVVEIGRDIDHWDDALDQTESFTYDLTGNRRALERDHGNDGIDQTITYHFDANDRLIDEVLDDLVDDANDTTTTYTYSHTQNTSKTVVSGGLTQSRQVFTYNVQGRMNSVVNEGYDAAGVVNSRERASYEYDSKSYRVRLASENGTGSGDLVSEVWSLTSEVSFLADHHNHTGYTQTIRETTFDDQGAVIKQVDYTFGSDEIAQFVTEGGNTETHVFGHDGHGSVRVLYDLAGITASIAQVFTFAAYGEMLAVNGADGVSVPVSQRLSSLGYSGEHFDAKAQQQYLRARFYDPASGRFNRLDPFFGNPDDPQSLHKYAYVHGDPIGSVDPTGEFSMSTQVSVLGVQTTVGSIVLNGVANLLGVAAAGYIASKLGDDPYQAMADALKDSARDMVIGAIPVIGPAYNTYLLTQLAVSLPQLIDILLVQRYLGDEALQLAVDEDSKVETSDACAACSVASTLTSFSKTLNGPALQKLVKIAKSIHAKRNLTQRLDNMTHVVNSRSDLRSSLKSVYDALKKAKPANSEAHHLIPREAAADPFLNGLFRRATRAGYDNNSFRNGMYLDDTLVHPGSHPKYNDYMIRRIKSWVRLRGGKSQISGKEAKEYFESLADETRSWLEANPGKKIEDFFEWM